MVSWRNRQRADRPQPAGQTGTTNRQTIQYGGNTIKLSDEQIKDNQEEELLTSVLCQALIIKREVSPDRFNFPGMDHQPIQCPVDCHACCRVTTILDLTSTESLMIYLLNRDIVDLIEEYTDLHDETGYCAFMIMDKCIINRFKPSACQMFMPFEYRGKPMCYYLAHGERLAGEDNAPENYMNSSSYGIHGVMMKIQCDLDGYLSRSFFKNIYEGVLWWKDNYSLLPENTRMCLESILKEEYVGLQLMENFKFEKVLQAGLTQYNKMVADHPPRR